jgi:hypothetical protein
LARLVGLIGAAPLVGRVLDVDHGADKAQSWNFWRNALSRR